jgi:hypothetical protein
MLTKLSHLSDWVHLPDASGLRRECLAEFNIAVGRITVSTLLAGSDLNNYNDIGKDGRRTDEEHRAQHTVGQGRKERTDIRRVHNCGEVHRDNHRLRNNRPFPQVSNLSS